MQKKFVDEGARIREIRGKTSQQEFAKLLGISSVALQNYEYGLRLPPGETLIQLAKLGNTSTDWILTGKATVCEPSKGMFVAEDSEEYEVIKEIKKLPKSKAGMARAILKAMVEEEKKEKGETENDPGEEKAAG